MTGDDDPRPSRPAVRCAETPTDREVNDVVRVGETLYAVGDGGLVCRRDEDRWSLLQPEGAVDEQTDLYGVDTTACGDHVWVGGTGGTVGRYDVTLDRFEDHSPEADTPIKRVAVVGSAGSETVYAATAGEVYVSVSTGPTATWSDLTRGGVGTTYVG
jgi:hypothetical protein